MTDTPQKTIVQSVQSEIRRHQNAVLKLEASAKRIAEAHKCPQYHLIRQALVSHSATAGIAIQL